METNIARGKSPLNTRHSSACKSRACCIYSSFGTPQEASHSTICRTLRMGGFHESQL